MQAANPHGVQQSASTHAAEQDVMPVLSMQDQREKQLTLVRKDISRLAQVDINKPFSSIEDAVERVLPFHLLASREADEQDLEDVECLDGYLLASTQQVWDNQVLEHCTVFVQQAEELRKQIMQRWLQIMQLDVSSQAADRPRGEQQVFLMQHIVEFAKEQKQRLQQKWQEQQQAQQQKQLQQQLLQQAQLAALAMQQAHGQMAQPPG